MIELNEEKRFADGTMEHQIIVLSLMAELFIVYVIFCQILGGLETTKDTGVESCAIAPKPIH